MKTILLSSLFLLSLLFGTACTPDPCSINYDFDFSVQISAKDTVNVGDTIWYTMDLTEPQLNNSTGDVVNLKPFDLYFKFRVGRLDSLYANYDDKYFETVIEEGIVEQLNNPEFGTFWKFEDKELKYFKIGLVALQSGLYRSELSLPYQYKVFEDFNGDNLKVSQTICDQYITPNSTFIVNDGVNNFDYVLTVCQQYSPVDNRQLCWRTYYAEGPEKKGFFAFVVR